MSDFHPRRSTLGLLALLVLFWGCSTTPLPTDPITSGCTVGAPEFNSWFESGAVALNGVAKPADSVNFPDTPNCSFYKWSEQMFLWLNSPAPPSYGGGDRIFKAPAFFDVSPLDSNFDRTLVPHARDRFIDLSLRAAQVGHQGLPVILDTSGTMFEIVPPALGPNGKQLILNERGQPVEIGRIQLGDNIAPGTRRPSAAEPSAAAAARPLFFDTAGNVIQNPRPLLQKELDQARVVQKFVVDKRAIFLDAAGTMVVPEQGQADGAVLMAQNGSLVFYEIAVNDVYAYFLTGAKNGVITPGTHFPTTQAELNDVTAFAAAHSKTFPDPEALAVEVKTAWVETTGLDVSKYITMKATIPTYDQSNPNLWTPNGQKTVTLALVAMHVVGSTAGHPEMVWATFEHESNAPSGAYAYVSTTGTKSVNPDFTSTWLFCAANPDVAHLNEPHMQLDSVNPENIVSIGSFTISPSNTIRGNAWGAVPGVAPNPLGSAAASNSELIALNNAVRGMLAAGDVRRRYIMTGATWNIGGAAGFESFGNPGNPAIVPGRGVGTSQLANTTMETYQQGVFPTSFNKFSNNCFSCHPANSTSVSHIYFTPGHSPHGLKPLF